MLFKDKGIVTSIRNIGEKSDLIKIFTQHNGIISGLHIKNRQKQLYVGASVECECVKKAEAQLMRIKCEIINDKITANCIANMQISIILASALQLLEITLTEYSPNHALWCALMTLFAQIDSNIPFFDKMKAYLSFEIALHIANGHHSVEWFMQKDLDIPDFILHKYSELVTQYGKESFILRLALHDSAKTLLSSDLRGNKLPESRKLLPKLL